MKFGVKDPSTWTDLCQNKKQQLQQQQKPPNNDRTTNKQTKDPIRMSFNHSKCTRTVEVHKL